MLEAAEAECGALHAFGQIVDRFGGSVAEVRLMPGNDLGDSPIWVAHLAMVRPRRWTSKGIDSSVKSRAISVTHAVANAGLVWL